MQVDGTGERKDGGKVRMSEIPPGFIVELARHANKGIVKYPNKNSMPNWAAGMAYSKIIDPVMRHLYKWLDGQDEDEELKTSHLICAAWGLMVLWFYETNRNLYGRFDDRMFKTQNTSFEIYEPKNSALSE